MANVAKHQDDAEADRRHYVYVQHAKMTSRRGHDVMCEEETDYRITPTPDGSHEELLKVDGRVLINHKYVPYTALLPDDDENKDKQSDKDKQPKSDSQPTDNSNATGNTKPADNSKSKDTTEASDKSKPPDPPGGDGIDRNLVENTRKSLLNDKSKDGIDARLFPLTSKAQAGYAFTLAGRERLNGRDVFHIKFRPKARKDFGWQGDAYIDVDAYQPVLVTTDMARKIPFAVRTLLGTNVPGLGFTVTYAPQPDGLWFPVSFATEFKLDVLFFFRREIILNAQNRDFEKTHGEAHILAGATPIEDGATPVKPNQP
jgi:hypothetical protein